MFLCGSVSFALPSSAALCHCSVLPWFRFVLDSVLVCSLCSRDPFWVLKLWPPLSFFLVLPPCCYHVDPSSLLDPLRAALASGSSVVLCLPQCPFLVRCSPSFSVLACALCSPGVLSVCLSSLLGSILAVLFMFLSALFWCAAFAFLVLVSALCTSSVLSSPSCPDAAPL